MPSPTSPHPPFSPLHSPTTSNGPRPGLTLSLPAHRHSSSTSSSVSVSLSTASAPHSPITPNLPGTGTMPDAGRQMSAMDEKRLLAEMEMEMVEEQEEEMRRRGGGGGEEEEHSRVKVFATVTFYLIAATIMVFANKWVLNAVRLPLTFLFFQLVLAVLLLHAFAVIGYFTLPKINTATCIKLAPLIGINVVGLTFNTYCLQYVDASFYQVARGLILPFTVLASWVFLSSRPSLAVGGTVLLVCMGFLSGVSAEHLTVSPLGVTLGVFSSMTTAVHAIVVKRSLNVTSSPLDLAYYNNLLSALVLLPALVFISDEPRVFMLLLETGGEALETFVMGALLTGVFGFLICIAGFLSIKVTSPVTHMISSAVRGVIQTLLGVLVFSDVVSLGRAAGIGFILLGSIGYTWVKDREGVKEKKERREREEKEGLASPLSVVSFGANGSGYPSPVLGARSGDSLDEKRPMLGGLGLGVQTKERVY